jgi:hypothetical protein
MSLGGTERPASEYRQTARRSLEEQVRRLGAPPFGDGSYYLGDLSTSDEDYAEFLAGHYADRREGIA